MAAVSRSQIWTAPNQLTLLRLLFVPFIAIAVLEQSYGWALAIFIIAGISDALDGLLARTLGQHTVLGQYLDPIADKLLLSTMFIVLSIVHKIPWPVTILVLTRDIFILVVAALLFMIVQYRDFRPSVYGKVNTLAQIVTVLTVLLYQTHPSAGVSYARGVSLITTMVFTVLSGVNYIVRVGTKLRGGDAKAASA
jgi:cardiolipin synthase (CMP-forming)